LTSEERRLNENIRIDINITTITTKMSGKVLLFDLQNEVARDPVFLVLVLVDGLATSFFA
jgi:hypothetical protein